MNEGIDYGFGKSNIDPQTGIRYGVISQHTVGEAWYDNAEAEYGEPHCPSCGDPATPRREDFDYAAECGVFGCGCGKVHYPMELDEDGPCPDCGGPTTRMELTERDLHRDHMCHRCGIAFDNEDAYPDEPIGWFYVDDDYTATDCLDSDIMIVKSPYFTYAQFCSPCVPGAGNLDHPLPEGHGAKCYCFGHDWFENNKAPYRIWSVETGEEVLPE